MIASFPTLSIAVALVFLLVGGAAIFFPQKMEKILLAFPRNRICAWALTAIDYGLVAYYIINGPLGPFDFAKPYAVPLCVIAFALTIFLMEELLAVRALGALIMLVADPFIAAIRWEESAGRLPLIILAYLTVIASIAIVLSPYLLRRFFLILSRKPAAYISVACGLLCLVAMTM